MASGTLFQLSSNQGGTPVTNEATGDRFTVQLDTPFIVDDPTKYSVVPVSYAVWYTAPNVSVRNGTNVFTYTSATVAPTGTFSLTLDDGLYSVEDLTATLAAWTTGNGHGSLSYPLFTFQPLVAVQKVAITIDDSNTVGTGFSIDATVADSLLVNLLGFNALVYGPTIASPTTFTGQNLADMAQDNEEYLINTDMIRGSVGSDGGSSQAIVRVALDSAPNSQLTWNNTLNNYGLPLANKTTRSISVWLTNGTGKTISLNNNPYSLTLLVVKVDSAELSETRRAF